MNKLIMLVGLPGSGKSTIAQQLSVEHNAKIYSSDSMRKELYGDENTQGDPKEVFRLLHNKVKQGLTTHNCIIDSTNISYKQRMAFLNEIKYIDCEKICIFIATPYEKCLEQNFKRERQVPEHVIKKMYMNFYIPQYYEGFTDIRIIWNFEKEKFDARELFYELDFINQDNPHHTLTIGKHCEECSRILTQNNASLELIMAARYHDVGKRFTKEFKNSRGEDTEIAHFFQHHLVSAYMSIFYLKQFGFEDKYILHIANLIQWHMQPFFIQNEKTERKYKKMLGDKTYEDLLILHEADKAAK